MKKKCRLLSLFLLLGAMTLSLTAQAQKVIFPQEKQPGTACVSVSGNIYTLSNDLFSAEFINQDGKLLFNGCEEMGLAAGTEIFKVQLGDGTEIPASEFTMSGITTETLAADPNAVKGSNRFAGVQIKATFTHSCGLSIDWCAVLRDGSHYLRTEEIITTTADIAMYSITPMIHTVQNNAGEKAPAVIGNTRGAVIASDKIFAGLETPTAFNTAAGDNDLGNFVLNAWSGASSWAWTPAEEDIPQGIKNLSQYAAGTVNGSRGYLIFRQSGDLTINFDYTSGNSTGNNRLQVLGVDILDLSGNIVDSDYHFGYTGGSDSNREYTVNIPEIGAYLVRYFVTSTGSGEGYNSIGTITYDKKFALPELVYDLASTEKQYYTPETTEAVEVEEDEALPEKAFSLQAGMTYYIAANAKQSDGTFVSRYLYVDGETLKVATEKSDAAKWTLEANGTHYYVKNTSTGKYLSYSGNSLTLSATAANFDFKDDAIYKVFGAYSLYATDRSGSKYMVVAADGTSYNVNSVARNDGSWCSDYILEACPETVGTFNAESTSATDSWTSAWTGFSDWTETLPSGTTKTGTAKYKDTGYYNMGVGRLDVFFDYTGGNHGLYILGVQIIDACGNVIAQEFKNGFTGSSSEVTYNIYVPEAGIYRLRYITDYRSGGTDTNGSITLTFKAANCITGTQQQTKGWTSAWTGFAEWADAPEGLKAFDNATSSETNPTSIQYIDQFYYINRGELSVLYDYTGGGHGLHPMGVVLMDKSGNVVSTDYHAGFTGGRDVNNTYTVEVPDKSFYTVRFVVDKNSGGTDTNGTITLSLTEIEALGTINEDNTITTGWAPETWADIDDAAVPARVVETGCTAGNARVIEQVLKVATAGTLNIGFVSSSSTALVLAGVDLLDEDGNTVTSAYRAETVSSTNNNITYSMNVAPGTYTLRYFARNADAVSSSGSISISLNVDYTVHLYAMATTPIEGMWLRNTTLASTENWKVSSVVGLVAPGQLRRSFLAYSERERAVPWRAFPCYISWYELNINNNNAADPTNNMTAEQVLDVLAQWKTNFFDKYGEAPAAFIIDDGWDNYGPWTFHNNFPNEMRDIADAAKEMGAGVGAWLGPVGGYGTSGDYRRTYWNTDNRGGMLLSNPAYYTVFKNAAENLVCNQDGTTGFDAKSDNYLFFKFDGISDLFSATGPKASATGNEDAEGIIRLERYVREELREDIFFNTTVGTWASPFWYHYTDATWRQENDYGTIGNNSVDRENWITYRDRLVYQNYVQNSPICPINTLMTHGFILTGDLTDSSSTRPGGWNCSRNIDYGHVLNEMRCAFVCGSGMVELYNDYDLMNSINDGQLWADLADCIAWQKKNADVLPDAHWVGGNPWNGSSAEIYGWAAWNGEKATFTLRNGANDAQSITLTLRQALEIPEYINTTITLSHAFDDQASIAGFSGITAGTPIDIDDELTITLPGSSVFVFDGSDNSVATVECGKYYRFKDSQSNYLAAGSTLSSKAEADASTIFYLTEDGKLLSYSTGNYLNKTGGIEAAGHPGNVAHFKNGTADGTVMIGVSNGTYLSSTDGTIATAGGDWTIEEVTTLPIKVSSVEYATFYAPIAVALPSEGDFKAYAISEASEGRAQLEEITGAIPANTSVIINAAEGTYNLAITSSIAGYSETNLLYGTVASTMIEKESGDYYILSNHSTEGIGMYKPVYADDERCFLNGGHKAYMFVAGEQNIASYSFRFGDGTTGIDEITEQRAENKEIYDLTGRKVENPERGVYIIGNKKMYIK